MTEYVEGIGEVEATYHVRAANCGTVNGFRREGFRAVSAGATVSSGGQGVAREV